MAWLARDKSLFFFGNENRDLKIFSFSLNAAIIFQFLLKSTNLTLKKIICGVKNAACRLDVWLLNYYEALPAGLIAQLISVVDLIIMQMPVSPTFPLHSSLSDCQIIPYSQKNWVGVRPTSQKPYPIYDQNLRYSLPYL